MNEQKQCSCGTCTYACTHKPGWFKPGQVELAAEHLNMPLLEFFQKYLGIDWWEADGDVSYAPVFILAPALVGHEPGAEYGGNLHGTCVFLKDGKCEIHEVKPFECAEYMHNDTSEEIVARHRAVAIAWNTPEHQNQIRGLLMREPETSAYEGGGLLGMLGMLERW